MKCCTAQLSIDNVIALHFKSTTVALYFQSIDELVAQIMSAGQQKNHVTACIWRTYVLKISSSWYFQPLIM